MTRKAQLIAEACKRYKQEQKITPLEGTFKDYCNDIRICSDNYYRINLKEYQFHYDEEGDTLCNWGWGMGLIYARGRWAGESNIFNYEIY